MSSIKRKRNVLTIEMKLEIINQLEKDISGSSLAVCYNIDKATVYYIKKQKEAITVQYVYVVFFIVRLYFVTNHLSEPPLVPISLDYWRSTVVD